VATTASKTIVRRFLSETIGGRDPNAADGILTPDYTLHMVGFPAPVRGRDAWKGVIQNYFAAFPDLAVSTQEEIAEGDRVAIRYSWSGTHRGDFMGIPATQKRVSVSGMVVFRVTDDRVAEEWHLDDVLGLLQQLGAIPTPGQSAAVA
jgi:steroid delta-isomerase-like uncharacterized protein